MPALHAAHAPLARRALYWPGRHTVHTAEVAATVGAPYRPAPQTVQTTELAAALTEPYEPAPHAVHALVPPASVLYVPPGQAVHTAGVDAAARLP